MSRLQTTATNTTHNPLTLPCRQSATRVPLVDLTSWWPLTWPNHPFSLVGNSCVPLQWNIILMFRKEKNESLSNLSSKFIRFYLFMYVAAECWQIQSDLRKFCYLKKQCMWGNHSKSTQLWQRHLAWRLIGGLTSCGQPGQSSVNRPPGNPLVTCLRDEYNGYLHWKPSKTYCDIITYKI